MQQHKVVNVAHVMGRWQAVLGELVQVIQQHVGKELAGQVANGQAVTLWGVEQAFVWGHQGQLGTGATHLYIVARVVHQDQLGQRHPPWLGHMALQLLQQHGLVNGHKEVCQIALEVVRRAAPVVGVAAHLVLQPFGGIQRATAWDAGATVGHKTGVKAWGNVVVQQVMHDAVAEACSPYLAWLGVGDDEADGAPWLVGARGQFFIKLKQVVLGVVFEGHGTGAGALGATAIEVGLHQPVEQVWICGRQQHNPRSSCGCCSGCRC